MNIKFLLLSLFISGCTPEIQTVYRDVARPILVCPEPPIIPRPTLYITKLTPNDATAYGKVSQYYDISITQLLNHIDKLELVIERYSKTSESYIEMNDEFEVMYKLQGLKDEIEGH